MRKFALTAAAALLLATGGAFAGSDHYGSDNANQPAATVDNSYTASIRQPDSTLYKLLNSDRSQQQQPTFGSNQNLFGNR
jgi:hypothetical protein